MNLIEAVRSGKKIRRKSSVVNQWYRISDVGGCAMTEEDVLGDDWEIESDEKIEITLDQFSKAWEIMREKEPEECFGEYQFSRKFNVLKRALGFK